MTFYKPLTPQLRAEINDSISKEMRKLESCQNNSFVQMYKESYFALSYLINSLPDGYPIPITKGE